MGRQIEEPQGNEEEEQAPQKVAPGGQAAGQGGAGLDRVMVVMVSTLRVMFMNIDLLYRYCSLYPE